MKKFVAIILLSAVICSAVKLDEVVKLPLLVRHYYEHRSTHSNLSFSDFLFKHYVLNQKAESEKDKKRDTQLPFKSNHQTTFHFTFATYNTNVHNIVLFPITVNFLINPLLRISKRSQDIWLPPKVS